MKITTDSAQLAFDTILQKPTKGIPSWFLHVMEHSIIERLAGAEVGEYKKDPEQVYVAFQRAIGTCMVDRFIPLNPLRFDDHGKISEPAEDLKQEIVMDGIVIDSPEAVVEHMEKHVFPGIKKQISEFDAEAIRKNVLDSETGAQKALGPGILKCFGGGFLVKYPLIPYSSGYEYSNYFMAYALYPEVMERHFSLQADLFVLNNQAIVPLFERGELPMYHRLGQDLADSRGMLMDINSLDKLWFPHFDRCVEPLVKAGVPILWHCDGNLNDMLPRLLDVGLRGFQGFQYEDGMDYEKICKMKTRDGDDLIIIGGASVTRTLPNGTPDDVKRELKWLVEKGPRTGLFLGGSSSITPGVPWENIKTLVEGLKYYREHGRGN